MGFKVLIEDSLVPALKALPALKNVNLKHFELGDAYPQFGPLTACSRNRTHREELEVQLDIGLNYSTDVNVVLEAGIVAFAISHLKIRGILSVKFKPILEELPVFAAIQLLFLNSPEVDLTFAKNLEIANFSVIRNLIFRVVNQALSDLMVLPNIININWGDVTNADTVSFQNILPVGMLRMGIVGARGLQLEGTMFKRLPDAHVQLSIGAQPARTATICKSTDPVWDQAFDLLMYDERQHISAAILDVDFTGRAKVLGKIGTISIAEVLSAVSDGLWCDVEVSTPATPSASTGELPEPPSLLLRAISFNLSSDMKKVEHFVESAPPVIGAAKSSLSSLSHSDVTAPTTGTNATEHVELQGAGDSFEASVLCGAHESAGENCDSVALLVCQVFGGRLPPALAKPSDVDLRFRRRRGNHQREKSQGHRTPLLNGIERSADSRFYGRGHLGGDKDHAKTRPEPRVRAKDHSPA